MSRGLSSDFLSEINDDLLRPALFVKASFSTELRLWTGYGNCSLGGQTYTGAGSLLSISSVQENSDLGTSGLSITLSGCDNTIVSAIRSEEFQGGDITVYLGVLQKNYSLVEGYTVFFKGFMDNGTYVQNGETITIKLDIENHLARLSRSNQRLYTKEDQKHFGGSDLGLDYIESIAEQELVWGE